MALTKLNGTGTPLNVSCVFGVKPPPNTVSVNEGPPAGVLVGDKDVSVNCVDGVTVKGRAFDTLVAVCAVMETELLGCPIKVAGTVASN